MMRKCYDQDDFPQYSPFQHGSAREFKVPSITLFETDPENVASESLFFIFSLIRGNILNAIKPFNAS